LVQYRASSGQRKIRRYSQQKNAKNLDEFDNRTGLPEKTPCL